MSKIIISIIRLYQKILSPLIGKNCRFYPTCSNYALEAVQEHGALKGSYYAGRRIMRCQPFSEGGVDPIPRRNH